MEIYKDTVADISINVPALDGVTNMDVKAYSGDTVLYTFSTVEATDTGYSVTLPFSLVSNASDFRIVWKFDYTEDAVVKHYSTTTPIVVITPYATLEELRAFDPSLAAMTDVQLVELEKVVRYVINSYCGQSFDHDYKTITVTGDGSQQLRLPRRLFDLDRINYNAFDLNYNLIDYGITIEDDYFTLSFSGGVWTNGTDWISAAPIVAPTTTNRFFTTDTVFVVSGWFGWETVPDDITLCTKMLARDYACNEDMYRRKKVQSVNSGTWRMDFAKGAFDGTGNVDVDRILNGYGVVSMEVI